MQGHLFETIDQNSLMEPIGSFWFYDFLLNGEKPLNSWRTFQFFLFFALFFFESQIVFVHVFGIFFWIFPIYKNKRSKMMSSLKFLQWFQFSTLSSRHRCFHVINPKYEYGTEYDTIRYDTMMKFVLFSTRWVIAVHYFFHWFIHWANFDCWSSIKFVCEVQWEKTNFQSTRSNKFRNSVFSLFTSDDICIFFTRQYR